MRTVLAAGTEFDGDIYQLGIQVAFLEVEVDEEAYCMFECHWAMKRKARTREKNHS